MNVVTRKRRSYDPVIVLYTMVEPFSRESNLRGCHLSTGGSYPHAFCESNKEGAQTIFFQLYLSVCLSVRVQGFNPSYPSVQGPSISSPQHVQTCSTWNSLYKDT